MTRALRTLGQRLRNIASLCRLVLTTDTAGMQRTQLRLLAGELRDDVPRVQQYGLTSHALPDAVGVVVAVGGSRSALAVIALDDPRYRPTDLALGEVALYHYEGSRIVLRNGGDIELSSATQVHIKAPHAEFDGTLHAAGSITSDADVSDATGLMQTMRDQYNPHNHGGSGPSVPMD